MWFVTARQAIEQCSNPMLKLRPLCEGTQKSKLEAKRNVGKNLTGCRSVNIL